MGIIDFPTVIVKIIFIIAWIFPAIMMAWVYNHTSSIQSRLEIAQRKERICGSHVFERETVRHVARMIATEEDPFTFVVVLISGGIVTICACISVLIIMYVTNIVEDKVRRILIIVYVLIVTGLLISLMTVSLKIFGKKHISAPVQEYISALDKIHLLFTYVQIKVYEAKEKNMVIGPWERYKAVLAKRVARENNLSTMAEAERRVDEMLASNRYELMEYIEFDMERDYPMLAEFVPLAANPSVKIALDKLASPNGLNPLSAYQSRFLKIYTILSILMFVVGMMWLWDIRRMTSLVLLSLGFFIITTLFVLYSMVA